MGCVWAWLAHCRLVISLLLSLTSSSSSLRMDSMLSTWQPRKAMWASCRSCWEEGPPWILPPRYCSCFLTMRKRGFFVFVVYLFILFYFVIFKIIVMCCWRGLKLFPVIQKSPRDPWLLWNKAETFSITLKHCDHFTSGLRCETREVWKPRSHSLSPITLPLIHKNKPRSTWSSADTCIHLLTVNDLRTNEQTHKQQR